MICASLVSLSPDPEWTIQHPLWHLYGISMRGRQKNVTQNGLRGLFKLVAVKFPTNYYLVLAPVAGEDFGHNQSKHYCSGSKLLCLLYEIEIHSIDSYEMVGNYTKSV